MENLKIDHVNISVKNLRTTVDWYKKIFNFKTVEQGIRQGRKWEIIRNGDSMLCLNEWSNKKSFRESEEDLKGVNLINHFSLRINNESKWKKIMSREDLEYSYESPTYYPHSTSWYILDPNGIEIEVTLWKNDHICFN